MTEPATQDSLFILWSSADPEVARNLVFMYAGNALRHGWWKRVRLIIWGPSARLACTDPDVGAAIRDLLRDGVEVWACRACADNYGLADDLAALGADVRYAGEPVTAMLRAGWRQLAC